MRILVACLDQELLWVIDDAIGGLYSIDLRTYETKCKIDCRKLFPNGKFEILSLFIWKEDYVVIIPMEADKEWILYNKISQEIEYRKVIDRKCREVLVAADHERNQLYLCPLDIYDPILLVELNTLTCLQTIGNWNSRVSAGHCETAWKGAYSGRYIFFPIKNTKILVRMDCETGKVDLLELAISEGMLGVDYAFGELWVLPIRGNQIYRIDEEGKIIDIAKLSVEGAADLLPDFARIVVQKRYLFLLPYYRDGIYVYDKVKKKTAIIVEEKLGLEEQAKEIHLRYWEYYIRDGRICFLPFRDDYVEISLETLVYEKKELSYPAVWSDGEKVWRSIWSHVSERDSIIKETDGCDMKIFLKYIQHKSNKIHIPKSEYTGEKVWNTLRTEVR